VRVATFNLHAGVDGWGRPTRVLDLVAALDADLYVLPEIWRGDDGPDFFEDLRHSLHVEGIFAPLSRGERVTTGVGGSTWQPRLAHLHGERGLYFYEHRELTARQLRHRATLPALEPGTWGLGLLTRLPIEDILVVPLGRLAREKVTRALIVARLRLDDQPFYALAVHGAHLSHGSHRLYAQVQDVAARLPADVPVLLAGDFNCWRPLLRVLLPKWRTLARGRTWPAPRPHSQIDHILGRGPWTVRESFTRDGGSDHLALISDLDLA